jgi:putative DNA primase/helicase
MDHKKNFKQAMHSVGIEIEAAILADGTLHRFHVMGDRAGSKNGWYILHADDPAAGQFGCFKRDVSENWSAKAYTTLTPEEKTRYADKIEIARQQREDERAKLQAECRAWCTDAWEKAKNATNENPYLKRKGVNAFGLKSFKDSLLVPVQDMAGTIHGLQFIAPDGTKKFKTGTNKAGHFFKIGKSKDKTIIISEGYATGTSIHQATGHAVVIAFDASNLLPVAQSIRSKHPNMKIVIAADDDSGTQGNPGLTKATQAARVVNGLLAIPTFPDNRGSKDSDFNDLARLSGQEAVRTCIEAAAIPYSQAESISIINPLDAAIQRLAALSPLQYDQTRKNEAKELGIRVAILDAAVKDARKGSDASDLPFTEVDPWPEPVNPATLLNDITAAIQRFIICNEEVSHAVALWVAMTWFIDVVQVAPLAVITAPEKRCGKSLLLSLLARLVQRPITVSNISPAALFRSIDKWTPTLLIDEADAFMKDNEELRGLLNSGHTRDSAYVIRNVGENFTPTKFNTWGAKAIAGIGHVADTLMDRAVILELRRKLPHEEVDRIRYAEPCLFDELRSKLARFAEDYSDEVRQARPLLPAILNDRAQDNWEPLLAIAMTVGHEWLKIGTTAALKLSGGENTTQTIGTELLSDIQEIFEEKQVHRISTSELINALCADDEKPWATYNRGLPIKPRQLAKKLDGYGIHSKTIRVGSNETPKGFERHQFEDAFFRYIRHPENIRHTPQPAPANSLAVADYPPRCGYEIDKETRKQSPVKECGVVADKKPLSNASIFDLSDDDLREVTL